MPQFLIRNAEEADLPSLAAAMVRLQSAHVEALPEFFRPFDEAAARSHLESLLELPDTNIRVAGDDQTVVGHVVFQVEQRPQSLFTHPQRYGHICQIEVLPAYRRSGVGHLLLADCQRLAEAKNLTRIVLDVWEFNITAQSFFRDFGYDHFGFKMIQRVGA